MFQTSESCIKLHAVAVLELLLRSIYGSADQKCVDALTDFAFLGHDNLFSQIHITLPKPFRSPRHVISRSLSLIHCLFRLVKCIFTKPLYKSAWYTLLSLLIFRTHAQSVKRGGRNLTEKKTWKYHGCCIPLRLCSSIHLHLCI